jgi:hypothetical protein
VNLLLAEYEERSRESGGHRDHRWDGAAAEANPNARVHWRDKAEAVADWRSEAMAAKYSRQPAERCCRVRADRGGHDDLPAWRAAACRCDNAWAAAKGLDGIADVLLEDDSRIIGHVRQERGGGTTTFRLVASVTRFTGLWLVREVSQVTNETLAGSYPRIRS